jgi:hypothetical protein
MVYVIHLIPTNDKPTPRLPNFVRCDENLMEEEEVLRKNDLNK